MKAPRDLMNGAASHLRASEGSETAKSLPECKIAPPTTFVHVYVIKSRVDQRLYIGFTQNLSRRLKEHNSGHNTSTKNRSPLDLVYVESYLSKDDALERERKLKGFKNSYSALKNRIQKSLDCV